MYHSLWPHPALEPVPNERDPASRAVQKENETAYRQLLVQSVLAILLPTEDLENECLTALVGQVFSEMIIGSGLGSKACEPWLLWEAITKIAQLIESHLPKTKTRHKANKSNLSDQSGAREQSDLEDKRSSWPWSPQKTFWLILQYAFLAFNSIRFLFLTFASVSTLPVRSPSHSDSVSNTPVKQIPGPPFAQDDDSHSSRGTESFPVKRPILTMRVWSCASNLLDMNSRMPWLCATMSMLQWCGLNGPGGVGCTNGTIDRYVSQPLLRYSLRV